MPQVAVQRDLELGEKLFEGIKAWTETKKVEDDDEAKKLNLTIIVTLLDMATNGAAALLNEEGVESLVRQFREQTMAEQQKRQARHEPA